MPVIPKAKNNDFKNTLEEMLNRGRGPTHAAKPNSMPKVERFDIDIYDVPEEER